MAGVPVKEVILKRIPRIKFPFRHPKKPSCVDPKRKREKCCGELPVSFIFWPDQASASEKIYVGGKASLQSDTTLRKRDRSHFGINSGMEESRMKLAPTDRLSDLDEDLLIHVLSFLPIKQAVRVCTVSKRWRLLWTYVPTVNFDASASWGFMHRVMSLHKPSKNIAQYRFC